MNGPNAPRHRIFVVVEKGKKVKTRRIVSPKAFSTHDAFYEALIRTRKQLINRYPPPKYRVHEGTGSNLGDFARSHPELLGDPVA